MNTFVKPYSEVRRSLDSAKSKSVRPHKARKLDELLSRFLRYPQLIPNKTIIPIGDFLLEKINDYTFRVSFRSHILWDIDFRCKTIRIDLGTLRFYKELNNNTILPYIYFPIRTLVPGTTIKTKKKSVYLERDQQLILIPEHQNEVIVPFQTEQGK